MKLFHLMSFSPPSPLSMFFLRWVHRLLSRYSVRGGIIKVGWDKFPSNFVLNGKHGIFTDRGQHNSEEGALVSFSVQSLILTADFFVEGEHYTFYRLLGSPVGCSTW